MSKIYELYQCKHNDEVVYIGQGVRGRSRHCNSGCSHVYELNKIHFLEGSEALRVEVIKEGDCKSNFEILEKELIKRFEPKFNTVHTRSVANEAMNKTKKLRKGLFEFRDKYSGKHLSKTKEESYQTLCHEFFEFYSLKQIEEKDIKMYSCRYLKKYKYPIMGNFSRYLNERVGSKRDYENYHDLFYRAVQEVLDIDLKDCLHFLENGKIV